MTLTVRNLQKKYASGFELRIPELHISSGETLGLAGNNGAGKTTFLRLILDLLPADDGVVTIGDFDTRSTSEWKHRTGIFLDSNFLIDFLTPDEFLAFVASTYEIPQGIQASYIEKYAIFFSDPVFNQTTRRIRDLSTGNAKKVGLMAALIVQPDILILDEPFASLDPRSQLQLVHFLAAENHDNGTTLLISSHDLVHITEVCDRIAVLEDGKIVRDEATTPETLQSLENFFTTEAAPASGIFTGNSSSPKSDSS